MKKRPIFGTGIGSISPAITSQRRVNCYYLIRQDGEKETLAIYGTPGLTAFVTFPTYPIRGMVEVGQYLYVVSGNILYQVCLNGGYLALGKLE